MRETAPAFMCYPKDILTSGHVMDMTDEACGIYFKLLMRAWLEKGIPNDPERLRNFAKKSKAQWKKLWPQIAPCWVESEGEPEMLVSPRMEKERAKQADHREKKAEAGRKGGRCRAKQAGGKGEAPVEQATSTAEAGPKQTASTAEAGPKQTASNGEAGAKQAPKQNQAFQTETETEVSGTRTPADQSHPRSPSANGDPGTSAPPRLPMASDRASGGPPGPGGGLRSVAALTGAVAASAARRALA